MSPRSIRRAAERQQLKIARKEAALAQKTTLATGPRTEEGKAISSLNNLRHGLSANSESFKAKIKSITITCWVRSAKNINRKPRQKKSW